MTGVWILWVVYWSLLSAERYTVTVCQVEEVLRQSVVIMGQGSRFGDGADANVRLLEDPSVVPPLMGLPDFHPFDELLVDRFWCSFWLVSRTTFGCRCGRHRQSRGRGR